MYWFEQVGAKTLPFVLRHGVLILLLTLAAPGLSGWRAAPDLWEPVVVEAREAGEGAVLVAEGLPDFPDFTAYESVEERKQAFFDFMHGYVQRENERVLAIRAEIRPLYEVARDGVPLTYAERDTLEAIAREYDLDPEALSERELTAELMLRVDTLPTSLVLAQAASESAWGTSRFARQANNLFGQWCFSKGCGVVPSRRAQHASHEVRAFASVGDAVRAYFHNLNTHEAYGYLRRLRSDMRRRDEPLDSLVLAYGLTDYSSRGVAYVTELQSIIRHNSLYERDRGNAGQS